MNNELVNDTNNALKLKKSIQECLLKIKQDYQNNNVYPFNLYYLYILLNEIRQQNNNNSININELITIEYFFLYSLNI